MDYQKALNILGLKSNFTEHELKVAWRKLSRENHPDINDNSEESTRKQQDINAAYEFLKKYAFHGNSNTNRLNVEEYINKKIEELDNIIKYNGPIIQDEDFQNAYNAIQKVINTFKADVFLSYILNKNDIDQLYETAMMFIQMEFKKFQEHFFKNHHINPTDVKELPNINCTLKEFYDWLLKIESKYSKTTKINKLLESEIEKYKTYAGYERLKILIDVCKNNTLYAIKKNNFQNIDKEIEKMHQRIISEVFEVYYSLEKEITDLKLSIDSLDNEDIKKAYQNMSQSFNRGGSFADTQEAIKKVKSLINEYEKQKKKEVEFKESSSQINKIYQSLIDRYGEIIKKYNIITDSEIINNLSDLLKKILQAFIKGCEGQKDLEYFNKFNDISFQNMDNDNKIITNIIQNSKPNKSNIYIKIKHKNIFDDESFFYLDKTYTGESIIMYEIVEDVTIYKRIISQEEFETEYISLERFLELSSFVGEYRKIVSSIVRYLYKTDKSVLYFENNKFKVISLESFNKVTMYSTSLPHDTESFEKFKDKNYVCEMIEKQVRSDVEEYKKRNSNSQTSYSPNSKIYGEPQYNTDNDYYYDESGNKRRR